MNQQWCVYYQAWVKPAECWFLTAILRSYEHLAFDRTIDVENSIFEFFVPETMVPFFEKLMQEFQARGVIAHLQRKENRFKVESESSI